VQTPTTLKCDFCESAMRAKDETAVAVVSDRACVESACEVGVDVVN
jgi:hypothetical protein